MTLASHLRSCARSFVLLCVLVGVFCPLSRAQEANAPDANAPVLQIGENAQVTSKILAEERPLWVYLPDGYENTTTRYPVIYLLDGPGHFFHATGLTQFLATRGKMPPAILVGIANTDRTRDFTPTRDPNFPTSGGSGKFLDFLDQELIPFVDQKYRTAPYRILIGHSFGGLVTTEAFLTRTNLFEAFVSISPSLWWGDGMFVNKLERFLKANPKIDKAYFMTLANEGGAMFENVRDFAETLKRDAPEGLRHWFTHWEHETHGSLVHRSIMDGLEGIYAKWGTPGDLYTKGVDALQEHREQLSALYKMPYEYPENLVNNWGYQLLNTRKVDEAIAIFQYNVKAYPQSANVYDSLGEAYEAAGRLQLAKASYERACARGQEISDANLRIYREHLEKVSKKLENQRPKESF